MKKIVWTACAVVSGVVFATAVWIAWPLPDNVMHPGPVPGVTLQDRHGLALRTTRAPDGSRGGWVPLEHIDAKILQAFLAAEDQRFFQHPGIDVRAAARAARDNISARHIVSGASTITMQTARILRPSGRNLFGKAAQALWALRIEAHLDKSRIFEIYLNRVPLGQAAVGVSAAAALYFNASAERVSLGQAALLAALARAPSRDNPLVDVDRARIRRTLVLQRMQRLGYAAADEIRRADDEPVLHRSDGARFLAPHFTSRFLLWAAGGQANDAFSATLGDAPPVTLNGTVRTTIDLALQQILEAEVRHTVDVLRDRTARHAAVVVLDNPTGEVLAWVGSPDFFADTAGQVDMVISPRQPGSALKPFLYGLALDRGYNPASVIPDVPRTYSTSTGPYRPQNYDRRFRGPVRLREALASSYNVPAVELAERVGTSPLLGTLQDAGFASLSRSAEHYGLGLALGNGDVTLLELANSYRGLANGGAWQPVHWIAANAPRRETTAGRRFLTRESTALILDILNDPVARIPGFGTETPLDFPFPAATKTGTSRHFTDNWAVAATARFTVAVWVGNFSGQPMRGVAGITGAGPLLHRAVLETARRYSPGQLPAPEAVGAVAMPVCILSGLRATPECPSMIEWFIPGTEPLAFDDWQKNGHTVLPPEYAEWLGMEPRADIALAAGAAEGALAATPDNTGTNHRILSPRDGDSYERPPQVDARYATIPLTASGGKPGEVVRWFVNGKRIANPRLQLIPGRHVVRAEWASGAADSVRITVGS
jgi:penicillin-binding protein 1C